MNRTCVALLLLAGLVLAPALVHGNEGVFPREPTDQQELSLWSGLRASACEYRVASVNTTVDYQQIVLVYELEPIAPAPCTGVPPQLSVGGFIGRLAAGQYHAFVRHAGGVIPDREFVFSVRGTPGAPVTIPATSQLGLVLTALFVFVIALVRIRAR